MIDIHQPTVVPEQALDYTAFLRTWNARLEQGHKGLGRSERKNWFYAKYNAERAETVAKTFEVSDDLRSLLKAIRHEHTWMVITEDWCVDSAFLLPVIAAMAEQNPLIQLRIVPRDTYPDIMDQYLTNGARSIPKMVVFDEHGEELFQWGPRPQTVQAVRDALRAAGEENQKISQQVIALYENQAWRAAEAEIGALLRAQV